MDLWDSFLLGLIQGITEFLPISSSGHLVLAQALLGVESDHGITFEVVVHFGSLCSILVFYRAEVFGLIKGALSLLRHPLKPEPEERLVLMVLASMVPALVVGLLLKDHIESAFDSPVWVCCMLIVTGFVLFSSRFAPNGTRQLTYRSAIGMGLAQAVAILPGISRSGSTITAGQHLGLSREESARFSFLMVIPVIAGAMVLELGDIGTAAPGHSWTVLLVGFLTSALSGYYALSFLIHLVKRRGIQMFAWYCWLIGGGCLWYFLS